MTTDERATLAQVERLLAEAIPCNDDGYWPAVIAARVLVAGLLAGALAATIDAALGAGITPEDHGQGEPWGYAIVVRAVIEGPLHADSAAAKDALKLMIAAAPANAFIAHGHFERVQTEPDLREGMGT
jgi:hypothetical protein